jgi:hypothetical protein
MTAMRRIAMPILLFAFTAVLSAKDQGIDELKARVDSAPPVERSVLCVHIAQEELRAADKAYNDGNVDRARAALSDIVLYSEKARDAAIASKKHLKNVEIALRKISEKLNDVKRTLNFEDQPPVAETIRRLEDIRTTLLMEMFKKEKK